MNVSLKNNDAVSGVLKVEIEKNDYAEPLDKNLHNLRKQIDMPGFRKGMVPLGIVKKLYGRHALAEEVNKLVSEKISSYFRDNDIRVLGEPIPNETEQKTIDFNADENFEFCFDVALSPKIDFELTKDDKLPFYSIVVDDKMVDRQVDAYRRNFSTYDKAETVEASDLVKGTVTELEDGEPKDGGLLVEDASLMPSHIKGKMEQKKFIGAQLDGKIVFNPYKAYKGSEAEIASFLRIEKTQVKEMKSDFTFEIKEIIRYKPAELDQDLYDRVLGADMVKDEAAFRDRIRAFIAERFLPECNFIFTEDARALLIEKIGNIAFADAILKRWLLMSDEKTTTEQVDDDYPKMIEDMKFHFAREKLVRENNITVDAEELMDYAKRIVEAQLMQYGLSSVPDDEMEGYAKDLLSKQETVRNIAGKVVEEKLFSLVKEKVTIETKEVTPEEFAKIYQGETTAQDEADT
jgi:trigger factor